MTASVRELRSTQCAICRTENNARELYPANLRAGAFDPATFSARRLPDRIHYRIVRCNSCGLVRSDPTGDPEELSRLYAQSTFDYGEEVANLQKTYRRYLAKLEPFSKTRGDLLEIGCGNGFFLKTALEQGYSSVSGVEPSRQAISQADDAIRSGIVCDVMRPGVFEPDRFDVICLFQVFDHLEDPSSLLDECCRVLRSGGLILCLNHNVESVSARLLKERSPIVDIEHTYLYSPSTLRTIFERHGFVVMRVGSVYNYYSFYYLTRLVPIPNFMKRRLLHLLGNGFLGRLVAPAPLGNMYLIATKP